ncbi:leucyl aminopeptidase [Leekyejoonella antrihumi]|uniref:Probable cytosol aminopeptidase n=1 Tax=Leekyejoonella antrihumi TaxID=1660198 RepID=A0A563E498_9MICO|nr:leucyl aminopeptidase [Leekyejoonella antrihumi]TWP37031.1 leucyl aminopeptidase [Leekyejoonella antrihumi]
MTDRPTAKTRAQALALLSVKDGEGARIAAVDGLAAAARDHLNSALATVGATAGEDEVLRFSGIPGDDRLVLVSGCGLAQDPTDDDAEAIRRAAGAAARALAGKADKASFLFPASTPALATAVAEGALFGAYAFNAYRSKPTKPLGGITVHTPVATKVRAAAKRAQIVATHQAWARDLINTPPLDLFPGSFADRAKEYFADSKVRVQVLDEVALAKQGCGGLIGVGRGSARPPRLVKLTYQPARAKSHLALVGKGITFDSGGLCLKPATGMITMKDDMSGAAVVAAATAAIAELGLPIAVTTYLCLAENMTGADAQRPGDVVTMHNGKSVEIINTDAEGRLVMADGLSFASEVKPDLVIDVATLTGAAVLALGPRTTAVLTNNDAVSDEVLHAAQAVGESMWPIPLLHHLKADMSSNVADVKHTGRREGGMITAALFLEEFVGTGADGEALPWAHLDIAGPAYNDGTAYGYTPVGATGHAVRTLVALAEGRA